MRSRRRSWCRRKRRRWRMSRREGGLGGRWCRGRRMMRRRRSWCRRRRRMRMREEEEVMKEEDE
ncbi:unnamed protein product, partial [Nesidiocoris tenuis]